MTPKDSLKLLAPAVLLELVVSAILVLLMWLTDGEVIDWLFALLLAPFAAVAVLI